MTVAAVVFAADPVGDRPAPLTPLGGLPMLAWAVSAVRAGAHVTQLIVVTGPNGAPDEIRLSLDRALPGHGATVVSGRDSRHGSLHTVLSILDSRVETVVLHDTYRPLAPHELVARVVRAVREGAPAAVPAVEVTETVKELDPSGQVTRTIPRESLLRLQMPRAVLRSVLEAAHAGCDPADPVGPAAPDDDVALAPPGTPIASVPGDHQAFLVGQPADLILAEAVAARGRFRPSALEPDPVHRG